MSWIHNAVLCKCVTVWIRCRKERLICQIGLVLMMKSNPSYSIRLFVWIVDVKIPSYVLIIVSFRCVEAAMNHLFTGPFQQKKIKYKIGWFCLFVYFSHPKVSLELSCVGISSHQPNLNSLTPTHTHTSIDCVFRNNIL